ncbi:hypothetical protein L3H50_10915, partial [Corynebacterium sp. MC-04]
MVPLLGPLGGGLALAGSLVATAASGFSSAAGAGSAGAYIFHEPALFTCGLGGEGAAFIDGALG